MMKVRAAEDGWNNRDPAKVSMAYTVDTKWRNRSEIFQGREKVQEFLSRKWSAELQYRLIKEYWAHGDDRIAVRFAYEYNTADGSWYRAFGNEMWEFDQNGLMKTRHASINDLPIEASERLFHWPQGRRPDGHPSLSDLGL